jgi:tRNA nucleotidyltransferase (CCA-adding enzyme)
LYCRCRVLKYPLPFNIDRLPPATCVVGGAVRDALLGRTRTVIDIDLVVPVDAIELARNISRDYRAGFVMLDASRSIARLVFDDMTVDFAQQIGGSLTADLCRRDYRMNAIAYHLWDQRLIDPLNGCGDLQQKLVRMVAAQNLADDPLRLLRGYRQAAQLGFAIEAETARTIQALAPRLNTVAAERVMAELRYLLAVSHQDSQVMISAVDLLQVWLPGIQRVTLTAELPAITAALHLIETQIPQLWQELMMPLRPTLSTTIADITLLCGLLGALPSKKILTNLTASIAEITAINVLQHSNTVPWPIDVVDIFHLFQNTGKHFPGLIVLKLAAGWTLTALQPLIDRYLDPQDLLSHPISLVNGKELMYALSLPPSPVIGKLLAAIQLGQVNGEIVTKQEAISYARSKVAEYQQSCG